MGKKQRKPDHIFEVSWEVCNKIGGIYTVLSTLAQSLHDAYADKLIFIGPDHGNGNVNFTEDNEIEKKWVAYAKQNDGLSLRIGRWNVPGEPIAILVDFRPFFEKRDAFFFEMWDNFRVESLNAYGDYDESVIFGLATGKVIENYCKFHKLESKPTIAHFHEWTCASGLLYTKINNPQTKTLFTTHATTVGRSICFNEKPLYEFFHNYYGDQMANELNVQAKHSIEKRGALYADCFTTVSNITADECEQLLEKRPDIVTPNGFEGNFVPHGAKFTKQRKAARERMKSVAESLFGQKVADNALFIGTSGRSEFRNKGIDVFIESMKLLESNEALKKEVIAFIFVLGWNVGPRKDLQEKMATPDSKFNLYRRNITHEIYNYNEDRILNALRTLHMENNDERQRVKVVYVPCYLNGDDGIFNMSYYDLLIGLDLTIFPSYYEPWGYTPLESVAFGVPTITTDKAGFGQWCADLNCDLSKGVSVIHRTDTNFFEVAEKIEQDVIEYAQLSVQKANAIRKNAMGIAQGCAWKDFVTYYQEAFEIALSK